MRIESNTQGKDTTFNPNTCWENQREKHRGDQTRM